ncbi:NlpC/P60 family protein [Campylobacter geochelonis]|uniref:NlpC/P60 family protein n=1 Tax=Campylobacter geochelonis TaxID=1780362 RepID=UPI0007709AC6|nr:NlpC/P60 family protein [Campylobacter geochelonis]CZE51082.1 biopolymer transport ExbB protein [Campylobacter geochelonis]
MKITKLLSIAIFALLFISGCSLKNSILTSNQEQILKEQNEQAYEELAQFIYDKNVDNLVLLMDKHTGKRTGGDCSGFVSFLNNTNNQIYFNNDDLNKHFTKGGGKSNAMYNLYKSRGKISFEMPEIGDLIFFANTTRNTKNKKTQIITHVGVIRDIYENGRVSFVHNTRGKNRIDYMNLSKKNTHISGKKIENSYILRCLNKSCLTSNKFVGYGKIR